MKYFISSIVLGLLLAAVFSLGTSWVKADLGSACSSAAGVPTTLNMTSLTHTGKVWAPANLWKGGVVVLTHSPSTGTSHIHTSTSISASSTESITVGGWDPALEATITPTEFSYRVTANNTNTCAQDSQMYSCKEVDGNGYCAGPCGSDSVCQVFVAGGTKSLGWAGAKCSSTVGGGQCMELPKSQLQGGPQSGSQLLATVDTLTNWVFAVFVVLAILFVLLAAFQFVTAGGEAAKVGEARQKLIWAVVGIVIALLAKGIVPVVRSLVGG